MDKNLSILTREIIEKHKLHLSKGLGQNFLIDEQVVQNIIDASKPTEDQVVLEIGPGIGTLTRAILSTGAPVVAVEIDNRLIPILKDIMKEYDNFQLIHQDIMKLDIQGVKEAYGHNNRMMVVANLPYYITTPIIMKLLETKEAFQSIVVMVQKEVAERMAAAPGGKDFGALSVAVQYHAVPRIVTTVPPHSFIPKPKVHSMVIALDLRSEPAVKVADEKLFFRVVKASFGQRRKTLLNSLAGGLGLDKNIIKEVLESLGIDSGRRGETLSLEEFGLIADELYKVARRR